MNKTLSVVLSVMSFLAVLNFFTFYWTGAAGITSIAGDPFLIGMAMWIAMFGGFIVLGTVGCKCARTVNHTISKLADIFFNIGMLMVLVNFFVFLWLGPVMSVIHMPSLDKVFGLGVLFFFMAFFAVIFLFLRVASKDLKDMFSSEETFSESKKSSKSKSK